MCTVRCWRDGPLSLIMEVGTSRRHVLQGKELRTKTLWLWSASELYRPGDRRLLARLVPTFFVDRGCRVVSATDAHGR
jgi:hypothetical protein